MILLILKKSQQENSDTSGKDNVDVDSDAKKQEEPAETPDDTKKQEEEAETPDDTKKQGKNQ